MLTKVHSIHPCIRLVDGSPFRPSQLGAEFAGAVIHIMLQDLSFILDGWSPYGGLNEKM